MKNFKTFLCIVIIFVFAGTIYAQDELVKEDITKLIVGKWEIATNKRAVSGDITFDENGKYDMNEKFHDGSGSGTKGGFELNCKTSPVTIKLCPGSCPGSEWTNSFGIIQILEDGKLEIRTSPDGNYPTKFPEDKTGKYSLILTKVE
ncbi:MAG: hypothetical protein P9L97_00085 [Candidatus Tenebribacter davisii]|nr:hypothetical protein [Candidatus Tenebribacter davisii]